MICDDGVISKIKTLMVTAVEPSEVLSRGSGWQTFYYYLAVQGHHMTFPYLTLLFWVF